MAEALLVEDDKTGQLVRGLWKQRVTAQLLLQPPQRGAQEAAAEQLLGVRAAATAAAKADSWRQAAEEGLRSCQVQCMSGTETQRSEATDPKTLRIPLVCT